MAKKIDNRTPNVLVSGTDGNDTIRNWADDVTISGGAGNDTLRNGSNYDADGGSNVSMNGGTGDDYLWINGGSNISVNAGDGNDEIFTGKDVGGYSGNISINGGAGNDYIHDGNINSTILGGKGDDTIFTEGNGGMVYIYKSGDGNDYIENLGSMDTLVIDGAKYTTSQKDGYAVVTVGKNKITLAGVTDISAVNIATSTKNITPVNVIFNSDKNNITLKGTATSNYIGNFGAKVTISGGKGADRIENYGPADKASINAGDGDDFIENLADNVTIDAGSGNDTIRNWNGDKVTINGGKGNDLFQLGDGTYNLIYASGDGDDVIESDTFSTADVIVNLTSGTLGATSMSADGDILVKVGKGSLTFKDCLGRKISVKDSSGKVTVINPKRNYLENNKKNKIISETSGSWYIFNSGSNSKITTADGSDVIINIAANASINTGAGNDFIINSREDFSDNKANNVTITGGTGNDTIRTGAGKKVQLNYLAGDGNDVIYDFGAKSTLSITGSEYSTAKSGSDVIVTVGDGKISLMGAASLSKLNITGDYLTVTDSTKSPVTVGAAVKTINASARTQAIKITGNALANSIVGGTKNDTINGGADNDTLSGGKGNDSLLGGAGNDSIIGGAGNDKLYGQAGDDLIRGGAGNDSLTGGSGNDSLWGGSGKDTFIYSSGDGKDVIYGFGDDDLLKITGTFSATYDEDEDEVYFKVGTTSNAITLKDFNASTFHVNSSTYKISGSKLVKS